MSVLLVCILHAGLSVVSPRQASTSSCQVRFTVYTLHYHVKPQPCHVKPHLGWVKHHAYHDKLSRGSLPSLYHVNVHTYLCRITATTCCVKPEVPCASALQLSV
ncbi:hypothetical protein C8R48DRAFT_191935 [Suillus tomentosus]|nr:hypothetical protein C8R48DRAFT_191935 [Suillus tomentosus]